MTKGRLEAFSDGVIAILITIMVLELKVPHNPEPAALLPLVPVFLSYVLSFGFLATYWNNHHHLMQVSRTVDGPVLWANVHLLFWLSLIPFVTGWMGENEFATWPVAAYGLVVLMSAIAYYLLVKALLRHHGRNSLLERALARDRKGKISLAAYILALPAAFLHPGIACALFVAVEVMWFVPDRRLERALRERPSPPGAVPLS